MVLYPKVMKKFYEGMEVSFRNSGLIAGKSGRHMVFPYTFSAKVAQFPVFYYFKYVWIWMYYPCGCLVSFYVFSKIHGVVNAPAYVEDWYETQRKMEEKEHAEH